MEHVTLSVKGMTCGHCVKAVETSVGELSGVKAVKVDLKGAKADVDFEPGAVKVQDIVARLAEEGYQAEAMR